ncbi:MAG: endonuclease III [Cryobacterium sp.]|nr:endonuclease III [Oligoflexia bacterium]
MAEVIRILKGDYPEAHCYLDFASPFQLLVATILSAQCTDERVNLTTPALFAQFPDARTMKDASKGEIEKLIQSTGFYKNKARAIHETSQVLFEKYRGEVPRDLDALVALRGVGRKTANVILGNAYGIPGFVVDTHVGRITRRLGFTKAKDPVKVEYEVRRFVPESDWVQFSLWLIAHGRTVCTARVARCEECALSKLCPKVGISAHESKSVSDHAISDKGIGRARSSVRKRRVLK